MQILEVPPSVDEYLNLRKITGLSEKSTQAAKVGLANALYSVQVRDNDALVAMGRVVGDGGCFFEIVDIAVHPDYQGKGLGKTIMQHIESYLAKSTFEGSYVSMIADKPEFYEKLGYKYTLPAHGMYKKF